jgi:hypothetical protein
MKNHLPFRNELAELVILKHYSENGIQSQDIQGLDPTNKEERLQGSV